MVVVWLVLVGCCCCNCIVDASIFIRKSSMHLPARCVGGCVACDCLYLCVNDRCPALLWGLVVSVRLWSLSCFVVGCGCCICSYCGLCSWCCHLFGGGVGWVSW